MNLGIEGVKDTNSISLSQKAVDEMSADEAGAAGYQNSHICPQGRLCLLAGTGDDRSYGPEENAQIEPRGPIPDVFKVETDPFIKVLQVVAAADLP